MLLLWTAGKAMALSCLWGAYGLNIDLANEVPPDVVIVASHTFGSPADVEVEFRILDEADNDIPMTVEWLDYSLRIIPDAELAPGTYRLVEEWDAYTDMYGREFTVVTPWEETELETPLPTARKRIRRDRTWGDSKGIELSYGAVDGAGSYEIEVSKTGSFASPALAVTPYTDAFLGDTLCGRNLADYEHKAQNWVRVRAVALDGTASDWSEPVFVEPSLLGCSVQPGGPVGGLTLALTIGMGLMGVRRRRERDRR